jgi:hypothetical protein
VQIEDGRREIHFSGEAFFSMDALLLPSETIRQVLKCVP